MVPHLSFVISHLSKVQGPRRLSVQSKLALTDRNMELYLMKRVSVYSLAIQRGTYDLWIWLKVTSLSSTTSVLNGGRISLEISSFYSKVFFSSKQQDKLILAINLLISKPWVILKNSAVSMTSTDMITSLTSMTSRASLASKYQKLYALDILSDFSFIRNLSGLNDLNSLNSLSNLNGLHSLILSLDLQSLMFSSILAPK